MGERAHRADNKRGPIVKGVEVSPNRGRDVKVPWKWDIINNPAVRAREKKRLRKLRSKSRDRAEKPLAIRAPSRRSSKDRRSRTPSPPRSPRRSSRSPKSPAASGVHPAHPGMVNAHRDVGAVARET